MATTDTQLQQLVINVGTQAQIEAAIQGGTITSDMLSVTTDGPDYLPQIATLPTASVSYLGQIYQYTGVTNSTYTNGYFYKCVSDGASTPTYSWAQVNVQPGGGGGLPSQTGNAGKFLTTDGTDASWSDKPLVNEATNNIQLNVRPAGGAANTTDRGGKSIAIGSNIKGGSSNDNGSIKIGNNINSSGYQYGNGVYISPRGISNVGGSIIIDGSYSGSSTNDSGKVAGIILAGDYGGKIGPNKGAYSVIIGSANWGVNAVNADRSTFICNGNTTATTITEDNTFWWGNGNGVYKIIDTDGTIPTDRFTTTPSTNGNYVPTLSISSGTATRSWTSIASSVNSSSTNAETVGAKLFYDTCGDIETLINAL